MKFSKKNMPKTRADLDRFVRDHGLNPVGVSTYRGRDIFIAETEYENDRPIEFPTGYYQVAWFINSNDSHEKLDVGRGIDFDALHDMECGWTMEAKRQSRINTSLLDAHNWINKSIEVGRLDA